MNSELFLFQFSDERGCAQVLADGPFTFDYHTLILKKMATKNKFGYSCFCITYMDSITGLALGILDSGNAE